MEEPSGRGSSRVSRREFTRRAALASAAVVVPAHRAAVHAAASQAAGAVAGAPAAQDDPALARLSAASRTRFEAMWQNVLRRHGDRLSDDQKARMRKIIAGNVRMLAAIDRVPLKNADPPATTLLLVTGQTSGAASPARRRQRVRQAQQSQKGR
jgi:hypothetical protein